jgi:hypothetical protein
MNISLDIESDIDSDTKTKDNEEQYPSFLHLRPKHIEYTNIFPEFPKSHEEGYATIIKLPDSVLSETNVGKLLEMMKTMQYSRSNKGGGGVRTRSGIKFFGD